MDVEIKNLIHKYTSGLQKHRPSWDAAAISHPPAKVIALSGSTGNAGCYLLEKLLRRNDVHRIFLMNRKGKLNQHQRMVDAFNDRRLDHRILGGQWDGVAIQVVYLEVDLSRGNLGLSMETYSELQTSLTHIIHSAWDVNYRAPLPHFEMTHIAGVRHLINLSLSSPRSQPPRLFFVSSMGTAMLYSGPSCSPSIGDTDGQILVPEAPIEDSSMTPAQGYAQSKYVAERIIVEAVKAGSGLRATICRVGQLCGSTKTGAWPSHELIPRILHSVMLLGVAPDIFPSVRRWVPVDVAASALIKQAFEDSSDLLYFSVENPFPSSWREILSVMNKFSSKPLREISTLDWADLVEKVQAQGKQVPVAKLLSSVRFLSLIPVKACMAWDKSVKVAPELGQCRITEGLLRKYLRYQMKDDGGLAVLSRTAIRPKL